MQSVILANPLLIILFSIPLVILLVDFFLRKYQWIFKLVATGFMIAGITLSLLYGATYQEVIIPVMVIVIFMLFSLYRKKKGDQNGL